MGKYKSTIGFLITLVLTFTSVYGGWVVFADDDDDEDGGGCEHPTEEGSFADVYYESLEEGGKTALRDEYADLGYTCVKSLYHNEMNDYFNARLKDLVRTLNDSLEDGDNIVVFDDIPGFALPKETTPTNSRGKCAATDNGGILNVSSFCVGMGALDIYSGYTFVLDEVTGYLPNTDTTNLVVLTKLTAKRNAKINQEYLDAQEVLEATVATYDEFRLAYPMHKMYERIIKDLVKYKQKLKRIRQQVQTFPVKFIDSTSTACQ